MAYPIKYIENNLVWNKDGECYAYYELVPYNYSFLSPEQKIQVHDSFRQLIAQNRDGTLYLKNCSMPLIPDHLCEKRCKCETINSKQNKIKLDAETSR